MSLPIEMLVSQVSFSSEFIEQYSAHILSLEMSLERIKDIALRLTEEEYKAHRDLFIKIAKSKYPEGFAILQNVKKTPVKDRSGEFMYDVTFNEVFILLIKYLQIEFEGKDPDLRDAVFRRIMQDIILEK